MKFVWILCLLAVAGGGWVGYAGARRDYIEPEHRLGPFDETTTDAEAIIAELLETDNPAGRAKVEVLGGTEFDFGVMLRNAKSSHEFSLKNVGDIPLRLRVLGSTCKCTVGTLDQDTLDPGESTTVKLEWTAKTNSGTFSQSADIKTNDPDLTELKLTVRGQVVELVAAEPSSWNVADVAGTADIELKCTLYNHSDEAVEIVSAEWIDEEFAAQTETTWQRREVEPTGIHADALEAFDLITTIHPPLTQGPLGQTLRLRYRTASGDEDHPP